MISRFPLHLACRPARVHRGNCDAPSGFARAPTAAAESDKAAPRRSPTLVPAALALFALTSCTPKPVDLGPPDYRFHWCHRPNGAGYSLVRTELALPLGAVTQRVTAQFCTGVWTTVEVEALLGESRGCLHAAWNEVDGRLSTGKQSLDLLTWRGFPAFALDLDTAACGCEDPFVAGDEVAGTVVFVGSAEDPHFGEDPECVTARRLELAIRLPSCEPSVRLDRSPPAGLQ